jgi:hypothetical protein
VQSLHQSAPYRVIFLASLMGTTSLSMLAAGAALLPS